MKAEGQISLLPLYPCVLCGNDFFNHRGHRESGFHNREKFSPEI